MSYHSEKILEMVNEIRELIRLMAEPQIAARDQKLREELLRVVGRSVPMQKAVLLMDGAHTQLAIHKELKVHQGNLSTLVKRLAQNNLLITGDPKLPKLAITIPSNFFEA
jgi:DNA-binding MarR family transcriptional regulator